MHPLRNKGRHLSRAGPPLIDKTADIVRDAIQALCAPSGLHVTEREPDGRWKAYAFSMTPVKAGQRVVVMVEVDGVTIHFDQNLSLEFEDGTSSESGELEAALDVLKAIVGQGYRVEEWHILGRTYRREATVDTANPRRVYHARRGTLPRLGTSRKYRISPLL